MTNADLIHDKFYKRWTSIYITKGREEGWPKAKEWIVRTFAPPVILKLRPHIERAMGVVNGR